MEWDSSIFLGFTTLVFLLLLLVGKILVVYELKSQDQVYRKNLHKISEIESGLESSRRRYLVALKVEGVAKNRVSQLKTRLATLKQHAEQLARTAAYEAASKEQAKERALEKAVLDAMGGTARHSSHFLRVMEVITQLMDLKDIKNNQEIVDAVNEALKKMESMKENDATQEAQIQEQTV